MRNAAMTAHDPALPSDFADYEYGLGLLVAPPAPFDPENLRTLSDALAAELLRIRFPG